MNLVRINVMLKKQNNDTCLEAENSFCFQWRKASKLPSTVNNGIHAIQEMQDAEHPTPHAVRAPLILNKSVISH
jgi:hypothetical protein